MFQPDGSWIPTTYGFIAAYLVEIGGIFISFIYIFFINCILEFYLCNIKILVGIVPERNDTALTVPVFNPVNKHFCILITIFFLTFFLFFFFSPFV